MQTHSLPFRRFAEAIGPLEVAALARSVPYLETAELARILTSTITPPPDGASSR